jgi:hypothetical protein
MHEGALGSSQGQRRELACSELSEWQTILHSKSNSLRHSHNRLVQTHSVLSLAIEGEVKFAFVVQWIAVGRRCVGQKNDCAKQRLVVVEGTAEIVGEEVCDDYGRGMWRSWTARRREHEARPRDERLGDFGDEVRRKFEDADDDRIKRTAIPALPPPHFWFNP